MEEFVGFLLQKVYRSSAIKRTYIDFAFKKTLLDIQYRFPEMSDDGVKQRTITDNNR